MKKIIFYNVLLFLLNCATSYSQNDTIINELNPINFDKSFSSYNSKTALFCGQLSELAYWDETKLSNLFFQIKDAYPNYNLNSKYIYNKETGAKVLLWCCKDFLVISFKGTEPSKIKDIITDVKLWNYKNKPKQNDALANMPPGHGGFRKSLASLIQGSNLFDSINKIIKESNPNSNINDFPIFLTGHSLGAALSQLFMECLHYKKYNFSGAYHFAPPLAVSCEVNQYMSDNYGDKVYNIVNYKDYIPRAGRKWVAHFGKFYRICNDSLIYKETEAYVKFSKNEYFQELKYHKLNNHLIAIRDPKNSIENINSRSKGEFPCMGDGIQNINPCN